MTTIFQKIETAVVTDVETAVGDLEQFFTQDVWPIVKATLTYIEQNAGSDLLKIASNALAAVLPGLTSGTAPETIASAVVGTVISEGEAAGLQIAQGAATLAVSMAAAQINQAQTPSTAAAPAATSEAPAA